MSVFVNYIKKENLIEIETKYEDMKGLKWIERFYYKILLSSLLHEKIKIVTIEPQKYSLGYEIEPYYQMRVGKANILINEVTDCSSKLLKDINDGEEFKRGLLILVIKGNSIEQSIDQFLSVRDNIDNLTIKESVILCENDGNSLLLFNPRLSIQDIKSVESSIE